jgi:hypothetical protein
MATSIAQPDFTFDVGAELERLKGQAPWDAPDSSYLGIHPRTEPDSNGFRHFDVYGFSGFFMWSACTPDGRHRSYRYGPYETAKDAYYAGERGGE